MTQQTPLNKIHRQLGARMVNFAGWDMPVIYQGVNEEPLAIRKGAGIFDVSHMGEIEIRGPEAETIVQKTTCNDVTRLKNGECQYSALLNERGTFVDDIIVNKLGADHFLICVNASNTEKDFEWIRPLATPKTLIENTSSNYFQIALQGPEAEKVLLKALKQKLPEKSFTFIQTKLAGHHVLVARTGYTGEDGCEIYGDPKDAETLWSVLMEHGAVPCGLGARDTLRLEAALSLYGHEIDDTIHPYESRLAWIVKLNKGDFIGREALLKIRSNVEEQQAAPPPKQLIGLKMVEPGIARCDCKIYRDGEEIGWVTSGTKTPSLDRPIALGYVKIKFAAENTKIQVDIHNKKRDALIVPLPFYKR